MAQLVQQKVYTTVGGVNQWVEVDYYTRNLLGKQVIQGSSGALNLQTGGATSHIIPSASAFESDQQTIKKAKEVTNGVYTTTFNTPNMTQFGEYIVEKKKLLWSGAPTMDVLDLTSYNIPFNSILQCEYTIVDGETGLERPDDLIQRVRMFFTFRVPSSYMASRDFSIFSGLNGMQTGLGSWGTGIVSLQLYNFQPYFAFREGDVKLSANASTSSAYHSLTFSGGAIPTVSDTPNLKYAFTRIYLITG